VELGELTNGEQTWQGLIWTRGLQYGAWEKAKIVEARSIVRKVFSVEVMTHHMPFVMFSESCGDCYSHMASHPWITYQYGSQPVRSPMKNERDSHQQMVDENICHSMVPLYNQRDTWWHIDKNHILYLSRLQERATTTMWKQLLIWRKQDLCGGCRRKVYHVIPVSSAPFNKHLLTSLSLEHESGWPDGVTRHLEIRPWKW
jgi:hypothetical protein